MNYINNRTKLENHEKILVNTVSQIGSSFKKLNEKNCFLSNKISKARSTIGRKRHSCALNKVKKLIRWCLFTK